MYLCSGVCSCVELFGICVFLKFTSFAKHFASAVCSTCLVAHRATCPVNQILTHVIIAPQQMLEGRRNIGKGGAEWEGSFVFWGGWCRGLFSFKILLFYSSLLSLSFYNSPTVPTFTHLFTKPCSVCVTAEVFRCGGVTLF